MPTQSGIDPLASRMKVKDRPMPSAKYCGAFMMCLSGLLPYDATSISRAKEFDGVVVTVFFCFQSEFDCQRTRALPVVAVWVVREHGYLFAAVKY